MENMTWLEFCDVHGRKVRVTISGHWADLVDRVESQVLDLEGWHLSDLEQKREAS